MSAAEKKDLADIIKTGGTKSVCNNTSPSGPSPSCPSPLGSVMASLGNVVGVAVAMLTVCVEREGEELKGIVTSVCRSLVDTADFECALCTG